ncbi:hypothetical protein D3C72_2044090 [compost metagenome]
MERIAHHLKIDQRFNDQAIRKEFAPARGQFGEYGLNSIHVQICRGASAGDIRPIQKIRDGIRNASKRRIYVSGVLISEIVFYREVFDVAI